MPEKRCAVCGKAVSRNTGTYYCHRLMHKDCVQKAETVWFRLKKR